MRKIAIIVGSKSDLDQCKSGFAWLMNYQSKNPCEIEVIGVYVRSQHRNTLDTQELLKKLTSLEADVAIVGAGWANHLTGCTDAFLRYTLKNDRLVIIGVAFEDEKEDEKSDRHNRAAILSITEVPGTQVIFEDDGFPNVGALGFERACIFAATEELPKIKLPAPRPPMDLSLEEALKICKN